MSDKTEGDLDSFGMGAHPLKKLRRQTLEDFEEEFATQGRPCVTMVDMRPPKKEPQKVVPDKIEVFTPIVERTDPMPLQK